ncbi:MAG: endonuclease/exonuclease/phosphatase family protein [Pirellulales bacterium]
MTHQHDAARLATEIASLGGRADGPSSDLSDSNEQLVRSRPRQKHGAVWWLSHALAWLTALSLVVVASLRIFAHDASHLLIWLNAFTRYVYLPAYACLAWAAWQRRWLLALFTLPVIACHVIWLAPDFRRDRRFVIASDASASIADEPTTIRIFFGNVAADNNDPYSYLREIADANPDIVVLAEYYRRWQLLVASSPQMRPYRFGTHTTIPFVGEIGIFSKLPIERAKQIWTAQRLNYTFDVRVDGAPLRLFCVHAPRPMDMPLQDYEGYWKKALPIILSQPDPAVIIGDFNATQYSHVIQALTADRLRSAHEDRGRGYATTWPNGVYPLPPIRIDQAFVTPGVECVRIVEGRGLGSDHKPLILDVQIRSGAQGRPQKPTRTDQVAK